MLSILRHTLVGVIVLLTLLISATSIEEWDYLTSEYSVNDEAVREGYVLKEAGRYRNDIGRWAIEYKILLTAHDSTFKAILVVIDTIVDDEQGHAVKKEKYLCIPGADSEPELLAHYTDQMMNLDFNEAVIVSYLFGLASSEFIQNSYQWTKMLADVEPDLMKVNAVTAKRNILLINEARVEYYSNTGHYLNSVEELIAAGFLDMKQDVLALWRFQLSPSTIIAFSSQRNEAGKWITVEYFVGEDQFRVTRTD